MKEIHWLASPEFHDYPAAENYLSLLMPAAHAAVLVDQMRNAAPQRHRAKDVLRASGLPALSSGNKHVEHDLEKIRASRGLSPLLLVRGSVSSGRLLIVADGYHRLCAAHAHDEDAWVQCVLVDMA